MLTTHTLRCEYAENPLGLDTAVPRLSWQLSAPRRGARQTAYQVRAASTLEGLNAGECDLWDSGRLESSSQMVDYAGRGLAGMDTCWWQVRAWDEEGQPGDFSAPACFEMGLAAEDWEAEWIGCPGAWINRAIYFRRAFVLKKPARKARVYMVGLGWSELSINGQRPNQRVLDPAQTDYSKRMLYSVDAVEGLLREGQNVIGVLAGNGWYGTVRLLLQLEIEYADGSRERIVSKAGWHEPWLAAPGPILENSVYDGEVYDARLEKAGWAEPGYEARFPEWLNAFGADGPGGILEPAMLEPVRVTDTIAARQVSQPRPGIYVFDLGQNMAGWARIHVRGEAGQRVSLLYAESLYLDGMVNQENLRSAKACDVYILKGGGEETWEPRFTYHGFRYIQVEGYPGEPDLDAVEGRVVHSGVAAAGSFACSNELLNRVHKMIWWTEAGNLHSIPTDCPQRDERMGWLNDLAARSEEALHNFDLARLFAKFSADISDTQDRFGAISDTAPFRWGRRPADPVSVCYLLIPWLLYTHYGDQRTMARHYDGMKRWVNFLTSCAEDGILRYSYYGDWAPPIGEGTAGSLGDSAVSASTPGALISTACYAYSARLLAQIANVLGKKRDAAAYLRLSETISADFNDAFWDEAAGGYGSNNQSCNAIALYMGLAPEERRDQTAANLVRAVEAHGWHLTTGNICTKYLLEALTSAGRADVAYTLAAQETYPSWGYMLAGGATTLWERWEHATGGGMNSHNHPMMGSVGAWFFRALAGIRAHPGGAGFTRFSLRPEIVSGLDWVEAELNTVRGRVACAWRREGEQLALSVEVPPGSSARVAIPCQSWAVIREGDQPVWAEETAQALTEGVRSVGREGDRVVIEIGSGAYHFRVEP